MYSLHRAAARVLPVLGLTLLLAGCPKHPGSGMASAPPPAPAAPVATAPTQTTPAIQAPTASVAAPATPAPEPAPPAAPSPASGQPRPNEFTATEHLRDIHFEFDKYDIRPSETAILDANAAWLNTNTD